jgi:hypothetical protein
VTLMLPSAATATAITSIPEDAETVADSGLPPEVLASLAALDGPAPSYEGADAHVRDQNPAHSGGGAATPAAVSRDDGPAMFSAPARLHGDSFGKAPSWRSSMLHTAATAEPALLGGVDRQRPRIPLLPTARTVDPATLHSAIQ